MKTRYIIVLFLEGIGCTLQNNDELHQFFFREVKEYKNIASAITKANRVSKKYFNDKVCVFKTNSGERLSSDQYREWYKDKDRLIYSTEVLKKC